MMNIRKIIRQVIIILASAMTFVLLYLVGRVLICDSFIVRGESMEPVIHSGERVWVNKLKMGARIYTDYDFTKPTLSSFRLPGFSKVEAGDLLVANYPYARSKDTITFQIVPPLKAWGDCVRSVQISASFSFHILRAKSRLSMIQLPLSNCQFTSFGGKEKPSVL